MLWTPNHTASSTKCCICELYFLYRADFFFLLLDVFIYQEKVFVKMTSVLAQSSNKVRVTNNEISHACVKTYGNILTKFWKGISG